MYFKWVTSMVVNYISIKIYIKYLKIEKNKLRNKVFLHTRNNVFIRGVWYFRRCDKKFCD